MNKTFLKRKVKKLNKDSMISIILVLNLAFSVANLTTKKTNYVSASNVEYIPIIKTVYVDTKKEVNEPVVTETLTYEEPRSKEQIIDGFVDDITLKYDNVDPKIVKSVIWHESRYDPNAINYNGTCLGLMQISFYWHEGRMEKLGVSDLYDPYSNILVGVDYLSELIDKYDDINLVLMLYSMNHNDAFALHRQGKISNYVVSVLNRANTL